MLLQTGIELELISDLEILNIVERGKRGGLCFVGSKRYVQANNKYQEDYDKTRPSTYIMDWDANNLYGWAMVQPLSYKDSRFKDISIDTVLETSYAAEEGYEVECDLHMPPHLHDKLREFPPAPENLTPDIAWFSDFQKLGTQLQVITRTGST